MNSIDVLVEIKAASINPIDYKLASGGLKDLIPISFPVTIGYDISGIVKEIGSDVTNFEAGDLIYARVPQHQMGTIAEYIAIEQNAVSKKPANLSFEEAASLPLAGLTALQSLERVGIKENDTVLIHAGSGGVGSLAIQYAKSKGAYVYTTTSTKNLDMVKALGADRVIDYKTEDYKTIVKDIDIVFDTLGRNYTLEAFGIIKNGGRVVSVVGPLDEETAKHMGLTDYKMPEELANLIKLKSANYKLVWMSPNGEHLNIIKSLVEDFKIKPVIDTIYPFADAIKAYEYLTTGRAKGKVVISTNLNN